jgi:hypothetical protein
MQPFDATVSHGVSAVQPTIVTTDESLPPTQPIDISWFTESPAPTETVSESRAL